jgi:formate dehydrogenase subunit gamma
MAKMVQKTTTYERIVHGLMAVSGVMLLLTGLGFMYQQELGWLNTMFGGQSIAKLIHNWGGVGFTVSVVLSIGIWLPESLSYSTEDRQWLSMLGGYLSKKQEAPPQGKLNAGQKVVVVLVVVFGLLISITGFVMWLSQGGKSAMMIGQFLHVIASLVFAVIIPLHIYLATAANPGTFRIMTRGDVPLYWAKKKHAKWVKEMEL